jgi:cytochrome c-type biogenesis protein CcmH
MKVGEKLDGLRGWSIATIGSLLVMAAAVIAMGVAILRGPVMPGGRPDPANSPGVGPAKGLAALEAGTQPNPDDWAAIAQRAARYFDIGQFDKAEQAYGEALALAPGNASLWSARGEARVMAGRHEPLPAAALSDFETAIRLDPKNPRARYFLAVKQDLAGDHQGAINSWLALLADTRPGAVWEADLRRTIEQVGRINAIEVNERLTKVRQPAPKAPPTIAAIPGPSAEDLKRASAMRPTDQRKMAEDMVARLETRLRGDQSNVDGWIMLIRSRMTLGQPDRARAALTAATGANPAAERRLREQAEIMGVGGSSRP